MLDLSKPLGELEGLTLFGDHDQPDLVYYLPDEIDLRMLTGDQPDIVLQIFYPDEAIIGGTADLAKAVGSILSLGVTCTLSDERRTKVHDALVEQLGRDTIRMTPPPWEDGSVELLLLDTQSGGAVTPAVANDQMVLGVVGSRRPSLSDGELSALFHARLERRGTALAAAALGGQIGSVAGVLYDLSFAALRPTVNLRMSANLNRCADFIKAGVGVQVYYVSAELTTSFDKMREEGIIKVDLVSEASDPESEKLVNESVKDFYDVLMRELFKPTVSPAEVIGAATTAAARASTSIVKLTFAYARADHERVIEVDYRKRSATRRTHNPQAHLRRLAELAGGADRVIERVALSAAWREFVVEVTAPDAFSDPTLRGVRVVIWRGKDDVIAPEAARDGGLRMPVTASPLADFAFAKTDTNPRRLAFVTQPSEPPFFRWQARFTYAAANDIDSPAELWSDPHISSSSDLDIFPDILAPKHETALSLGVGLRKVPRSVEADLVARNPKGEIIAQHRLVVDATRPSVSWGVRRGETDRITTEATLRFRYDDSSSLTRPVQKLRDRELIANDPFIRTVTLAPLVANAPAGLAEIVISAHYRDPQSEYQADVTRRLAAPDFRGDDLVIPVVNATDAVSWIVTAVRAGAAPFEVARGTSPGGVLPITFSATRRFRFEWLGPTPTELGLRTLRAVVRARDGNGQILETVTLEWRGEDVDGERVATLPTEGIAEWMIEKRFEDGHKERSPFIPVDSDLMSVPI
jgi:hypothetical protein